MTTWLTNKEIYSLLTVKSAVLTNNPLLLLIEKDAQIRSDMGITHFDKFLCADWQTVVDAQKAETDKFDSSKALMTFNLLIEAQKNWSDDMAALCHTKRWRTLWELHGGNLIEEHLANTIVVNDKQMDKLQGKAPPKLDDAGDIIGTEELADSEPEEFVPVISKSKKKKITARKKATESMYLPVIDGVAIDLYDMKEEEAVKVTLSFPFKTESAKDRLLYVPGFSARMHKNGNTFLSSREAAKYPADEIVWAQHTPECWYQAHCVTPLFIQKLESNGYIAKSDVPVLLGLARKGASDRPSFVARPMGLLEAEVFDKQWPDHLNIPTIPDESLHAARRAELEFQVSKLEKHMSPNMKNKANFIRRWVRKVVDCKEFVMDEALDKFLGTLHYHVKRDDRTAVNKAFFGFLTAVCANRKRTETLEQYEKRTAGSRRHYFGEQAEYVWSAYTKTASAQMDGESRSRLLSRLTKMFTSNVPLTNNAKIVEDTVAKGWWIWKVTGSVKGSFSGAWAYLTSRVTKRDKKPGDKKRIATWSIVSFFGVIIYTPYNLVKKSFSGLTWLTKSFLSLFAKRKPKPDEGDDSDES